MSADQTLSLSWTRHDADARTGTYRRSLYIVLSAETLMGLYALLAPSSFSALLGILPPVPGGWVRGWGFLFLFATAFQVPGVMDPVRRRWANVVGIGARFLSALLYILLAGGFLWLALVEFAAGILLALLYFQLFMAELMSRP